MSKGEVAVTAAWITTSAVSITGAALGAWSWWWVLLGAGWLPAPAVAMCALCGYLFLSAWSER